MATSYKPSKVTMSVYLQQFGCNFECNVAAAAVICTCAELSYRVILLILTFDIAASRWPVWDNASSLTFCHQLTFT